MAGTQPGTFISKTNRYRPGIYSPHRDSRGPLHTESDYGRMTPDSINSLPEKKPSLDFTQRIERKLAEYNASENVLKRWLMEIASWVVSAACMGAIIGIYLCINNQRMTENEYLLTVSNVLGKFASAALIVPTSEALGQLKWNWFHESNAMWDFEIFDKATRGPWGAAMLFFRTKGRSLAALGALLIVLLLAIDTFFQQVVTFPDRWAIETTLGAIPRVVNYKPGDLLEYYRGYESSMYDKNLRPIMQEFFYGNGTQPIDFGNGTRPDIPLSCPTSSCAWPPYETLAVCSTCEEVSHLLDITYTCLNMTIDWSTKWDGPIAEFPYPNGTVCGHFINATSTAPVLMSGYSIDFTGPESKPGETLLVRAVPLTGFLDKEQLYGTGSVNFKDKRHTIIDVLIASAPNGVESVHQKEAPIINECVLSWCVQTMKSSYDWGKYSEEILAKFENLTAGPYPWISYPMPESVGGGTWIEFTKNITIIPPTSRLNGSTPTAFDSQYGVGNTTVYNVICIFDDIFPSFFTARTTGDTHLRFKNFIDGSYIRALNFNPWQAPNDLSRHMERLATAMTNAMRSSVNTRMLSGEAYNKEKFVSIQWGWLAFPLALLILSLVFLVATIIKTSKDNTTGFWKTSAMPALIYSLPKETQTKIDPSSTWKSAQEGKKIRIKLLPNMGWRVSGQSHLSKSPRLPLHQSRAPEGWI
ncbi:hypothetical protein P153DRAFT_366083 [Dothidotthia symphoricarpi CBS 119687]|uniref:DUF3176 domain containing protein n=1 Tax=Dothidotthia symphoricarpi CBS 119687 TaxID=1392245 RepID=A0A6A6AJ92_9PLEO|nr:uncharacterized protein P153DRAFT_366083 [Dothidotthia symphoricarpi CBS 119687]KAF2130501.1 hypothetical protein P153DRAFT_366083 [Dothidotthia symphoricarpi CBS 119687]